MNLASRWAGFCSKRLTLTAAPRHRLAAKGAGLGRGVGRPNAPSLGSVSTECIVVHTEPESVGGEPLDGAVLMTPGAVRFEVGSGRQVSLIVGGRTGGDA